MTSNSDIQYFNSPVRKDVAHVAAILPANATFILGYNFAPSSGRLLRNDKSLAWYLATMHYTPTFDLKIILIRSSINYYSSIDTLILIPILRQLSLNLVSLIKV